MAMKRKISLKPKSNLLNYFYHCLFGSLMSIVFGLMVLISCHKTPTEPEKEVPREEKWGIYELQLVTNEIKLIYSSADKISGLRLNNNGDNFAFSQKVGGNSDQNEEIFTISVNGTEFRRLTNNNIMDVYPAWSPDDSQIAFLSKGEKDLDVFVMNVDGSQARKLYDSGFNDADIDWVKNWIVFTRNSQIWIMRNDGSEPRQVTDPPKAGQWGNANLPFGDYDPRLSPDGAKIIFERLVNDESPHGNYNFYVINVDGSGELALTNNGYTQGLANWSPTGDKIVYLVTAIADQGKYDIYLMDADGSNNKNITPDYFPNNFLCHSPIFSKDGNKIYFVGEWW